MNETIRVLNEILEQLRKKEAKQYSAYDEYSQGIRAAIDLIEEKITDLLEEQKEIKKLAEQERKKRPTIRFLKAFEDKLFPNETVLSYIVDGFYNDPCGLWIEVNKKYNLHGSIIILDDEQGKIFADELIGEYKER